MNGGEPDIPVYKVIECKGPTNTRIYTVAVYFRGKRLASASGHSIQQSEMKAAEAALENSAELFPQLDYQKRVIAQSIYRQKGGNVSQANRKKMPLRMRIRHALDDESNLPKQYRTRQDISSDELDGSCSSDDEDGGTTEPKAKEEKSIESIKSATKSDENESDIDTTERLKTSDDSSKPEVNVEVIAEQTIESPDEDDDGDLSDASMESGEIS